MKELPGLYWDEAKNRYFPTSSRQKQSLPTHQKIVQKSSRNNVKTWNRIETIRTTDNSIQKLRASHDILCSQYASTSRMHHVQSLTLGTLRAFCSTTLGGKTWRFVGDNQGWLYSDKSVPSEEQVDDDLHKPLWSTDLNLQPSCEISSMSISGSRFITTCLGPGKLSVQDLNLPERTFLLSLPRVFDIRSSHLQNKTLVLGAHKSAVYISDIDVSATPQVLHTNSDIFSVFQQDHLVYTGARNGTIGRFDMRIAKRHSQKLFDDRFSDSPRSPVLHLNVIRESELLISHLNGNLATFDLRFPSIASSPSPVRLYENHVNSYTHNLGIAVDQDQDLLFAAGQDCRIRGWSLRTGAPLLPPQTCSSSFPSYDNPFSAKFSHPVGALQVTQELGSAGTCLWAACDKDLYQYHLGQRSIMTNR
ncbi:hypothetical protein BYT27DRAFT_7342981 [Phlegmacium glaucopus]|nr:hypothetical protein BYT27DRAFT_7342981 [Phlegmacium glaucopus]